MTHHESGTRPRIKAVLSTEYSKQQYGDVFGQLNTDVDVIIEYLLTDSGFWLSPHPLFDAEWYLENNPDVRTAKINPFVHYIHHGAGEGRDPHPLFDTSWYQEKYPDIALLNLKPLEHYIKFGADEGCQPNPLFSPRWYYEHCPEARAFEQSPLEHYVTRGAQEGYSPHPLFDAKWYLEVNADVRAAKKNPLVHYIHYGAGEGRNPHPLFDVDWYYANNPDVRDTDKEALTHYLLFGFVEQRDPHPLFEERFYQDTYSAQVNEDQSALEHFVIDGARTFNWPNRYFDTFWYMTHNAEAALEDLNPLTHYIAKGCQLSLSPHPKFDARWYTDHNPDISTDGYFPLYHYLRFGSHEDRLCAPPDEYSPICRPTDIGYKVFKADLNEHDKICVFVTYSPTGEVAPYVEYQIRSWLASDYKVLLVLQVEGLNHPLPQFYDELSGLILRKNHGWDFAAWAASLTILPILWRAETLILTNDSMFGPISSESFRSMLVSVERSSADVVGLTDSYQIKHHLMSYFICLKSSALRSEGTVSFWNSVMSFKSKDRVIENYELNFMTQMKACDLNCEALHTAEFEAHSAINPTLHGWKQLLRKGFPYVKVQALRDELDGVDRSDWENEFGSNLDLLQCVCRHLETGRGQFSAGMSRALPAKRRVFVNSDRIYSLYGGMFGIRPTLDTDLSLEVPLRCQIPRRSTASKIAVHLHVFYLDLVAEMVAAVLNIPEPFDLFISTDDDEKARVIAELLPPLSGLVEIAVFPNVGRDLAPLLVGFREFIRNYDLILHIHTKKSLHNSRMSAWRDYMLRHLLGTPDVVRSIIHLTDHSELGFVFPDHFPSIRSLVNWGGNYGLARELGSRIGFELDRTKILDFPTGSFFWARTEALAPILDLNLTWDDFPAERGQIDGTLAHALERILLFSAEKAGFRWTKVGIAGEHNSDRLIPVTDTSQIADAVRTAHVPLLANSIVPFDQSQLVPELSNTLTWKSTNEARRLNLIVPTLEPSFIYGGISTALKVYRSLASAVGPEVDLRIIVQSKKLSLAAAAQFLNAIVVSREYSDVFRNVIVDVSDGNSSEISLRQHDVFIATAWWTAVEARAYQCSQKKYFGSCSRFIYLIQDYEAGFYPWSSRQAIAESTYQTSDDFVAILNSEELAAFMINKYNFGDAYVLGFEMSEAVRSAVSTVQKERLILVYGRPSTDRNCFALLCLALAKWQSINPVDAANWKIISLGEDFDRNIVRSIANFEVYGKVSLEEYGSFLSRASVGVSLMLSPHPSYPPLEMASAGMMTVSNCYATKDLSIRSENIISVQSLSVDAVCQAIVEAVRQSEISFGEFTLYRQVRGLQSSLSEYNPIDVVNSVFK